MWRYIEHSVSSTSCPWCWPRDERIANLNNPVIHYTLRWEKMRWASLSLSGWETASKQNMIWRMADKAMMWVNLPHAALSYQAEIVPCRRSKSHRWMQADLCGGTQSGWQGCTVRRVQELLSTGFQIMALPSESPEVNLFLILATWPWKDYLMFVHLKPFNSKTRMATVFTSLKIKWEDKRKCLIRTEHSTEVSSSNYNLIIIIWATMSPDNWMDALRPGQLAFSKGLSIYILVISLGNLSESPASKRT